MTAGLAEQLARSVGTDVQRRRHATLSERELEVLRLIGSELAASQIAERMALSVETVGTDRHRVFDKMGLAVPDRC